MRIFTLTLLLVALSSPLRAETIPISVASAHIGQIETVEGVVSEVHTARSGKATFIDLGGVYPDQLFTGVIFARSMSAVGDVSDLAGKTVDITGRIQLYDGKPEIIVTSRAQIRVK